MTTKQQQQQQRRRQRYDHHGPANRSVSSSSVGWMKLALVSTLLILSLVVQPIHGQRAAVNMGTTTQSDNQSSGKSRIKKRQLAQGKNKMMNGLQNILPKLLQKQGQKQTTAEEGNNSSSSPSRTTTALNKWYLKKAKRLPPPEWTIGTTVVLLYLIVLHTIWLKKKKNRQDKKIVLTRKLSLPPPHIWEDDEISIKEDGSVTQKSGLESIDLAFEGIQLEMSTSKKKKKKTTTTRLLLDGSIHGRAKPGRMLAVMGPSGAGKSVFVHALAGRLKDSKKLSLMGRRYINGHIVEGDSLLPAAFVEQDVNFFPHMTVRETLEFRVSLKLGSLISTKQRDKIVENLMKQLGLLKSADTIVGDTKVRGLSGGERKRLSIAVEMISSPSLIFLDEPTSGLDSSAAANLVGRLRDLANEGKTVVAVIHQPSQHVFSMFDDLLLLSEGRQMYFGPTKDVRSYMEKQGYKAEDEVGTAEYVLECISKFPRSDETDSDANDRVTALAEYAQKEQKVDLGLSNHDDVDKNEHYAVVSARHGPRASIFKQFGLLMKRAGREALRGKGVLILKTVQQVTVSLIYGGIYKLGTNQASIQDRYGLISLTAIGSANMAIASSIRAFPKEKAVVANEIASKMYRTLPYFVGKAISELPLVAFYNGIFMTMLYKLTGMNPAPGKLRQFLSVVMMHGLAAESLGLAIGAVSPNSDVALGLFPAVLVLNIIFDGRNISVENTPKYLRWIAKIGLIRWGFEGLSLVEFTGLKFDTGGPRRGPVAKTGQEALERLGLGERTLGTVFKAQLALTAVCWGLSFIGMTLTRQKFLVMKPPKP